MKKYFIFAFAFSAVAFTACKSDKTEAEKAEIDSILSHAPEEIVFTQEEEIAKALAEGMTDEIAVKLENGDAAAVTDLVNQANAQIAIMLEEGEEGAPAYAAQIMTFLKTNKDKLAELSVDVDNLKERISEVPGVDEAIGKAQEALKAAKEKAADATAKLKDSEVMAKAKEKAAELKEKAKSVKVDEIKQKAQDKIQEVKNSEEYQEAAERAAELKEQVENSDLVQEAKEKAAELKEKTEQSEAVQETKEKAAELKEKVKNSETVNEAKEKAAEAAEALKNRHGF